MSSVVVSGSTESATSEKWRLRLAVLATLLVISNSAFGTNDELVQRPPAPSPVVSLANRNAQYEVTNEHLRPSAKPMMGSSLKKQSLIAGVCLTLIGTSLLLYNVRNR
jgi:hypothetical protein